MHNIPSDWVFNFRLSKSIEILNNCTMLNSPNIKFTKKENYLTGFTITIRDSYQDKAEQKSRDKAKRLADILTIKSGMPIEVNLADYHSVKKENELKHVTKTLTIIYNIDGGINNLDLNDSNIQNIIHSSKSKSLIFLPCQSNFSLL